MIKNWLREIVEEFKSLPIDQRVLEFNSADDHEIIRAVDLIQNEFESNIIENLISSEFIFKLSGTSHGDMISLLTELQYSIVEIIDAANDERFALAA